MYGREYHNSVKQLSIILQLKKKKIKWLVELNFSQLPFNFQFSF